ncbi:MAG: tyrosine-type recombinase/integrase, partial [Acidilobus sp.]|nr:tyrosine-type recombinase/integrase [Acidilobus sp.]MCG2896744.1 tyrosine-type recombinase/integrase [Acidilobus sp.]
AYSQILGHLYKTGHPWDVVLLVQLRNGSRIGEAIEAVRQFCETKATAVRVRIEKHKEGDTRLMVLPEELRGKEGKEYLAQACLRLAKVKNPKSAVKVYCKATYGFNTHSLRYAYITYLLSKGVNPSLVAKITGHKNLSYILHYTQLKTAEDILLSVK